MQHIKLKKEPNLVQKKNAFDFQVKAENFVRDLEYAAIFHEQGLGKTKIAIDVILYWLEKKEVDTILLVTKKSLLSNWEREFASHSHLKARILSQNSMNNFYVLNSPTRLILTHFEVILTEYERIKLLCKTRNLAIVIDESAKIKNPDSIISQKLFDLSEMFTRRIIMTGTPVANRPYDIWAQIYFLDKGKSLGTDFHEFKKKLDLDNNLEENKEKQIVLEEGLTQIFGKISHFAIRETKESSKINLPPKIYHKIICDWEHYQFDMYQQVKNDLRLVIHDQYGTKFDYSESVLKRLLRLIQITSNPKILDKKYEGTSGKLDSLRYLIESIQKNGDKLIIWTTFIDNVLDLGRELRNYNCALVYGKLTIEERNNALFKFQNDAECRILIATPQSSKEGLTLTVANHSIFYDRNLSLDDYLQAQDRIHRISQLKDCHIYELIMKDSIDEWIESLIFSKHLAAKLAQGDITLEEYRSNSDYSFGSIVSKILGGNSNE